MFQLLVVLFIIKLYARSNIFKYDTEYFIPSVGIEDYNVLIDGHKFFDQPIKK